MNAVLSGQASKFLVALLAVLASALPVYFGSARWEPVVIQLVGALLVYLVPNAPKPADAPPAPKAPGPGLPAA